MSRLGRSRYSWGGDEHLVVQIAEAMSLEANFTAMAMSTALAKRALDGVVDICPANASLLIRFNPDVIAPRDLEAVVRGIETDVAEAPHLSLDTRIFEVPVWYDDPYTNETGARFRDRHQRPEGNDLEFAAIENGLDSVQAFIEAHSSSPWITSMVGFVAGLPFLFQMVERERQLEVPKYIRPRTDTPALTVGYGGCFSCIYSVRGAGGYQMFGITPVPIFDPEQKLPDFEDFMVFFRPGDIVKFRPIDEAEYHGIRAEVEARTYRFHQAPVRFTLEDFLADPTSYNAGLLEALNVD
ncbi:MAG TPA: carboxyltransferase domain-containing protein [Intrasporangium sp.]|uniref:5-oxoprolinase subunit B family protein n=1 Tax=Intrasporangium sp. TaxID=1925024 RepID=UPI002D77BDC9|nr:carboxyltransferase domain-containing protein [Intrasporangium sp.]HET7399123.1 carboxyltransferase domain-containing protein [Intrasporangium sp.]